MKKFRFHTSIFFTKSSTKGGKKTVKISFYKTPKASH